MMLATSSVYQCVFFFGRYSVAFVSNRAGHVTILLKEVHSLCVFYHLGSWEEFHLQIQLMQKESPFFPQWGFYCNKQ